MTANSEQASRRLTDLQVLLLLGVLRFLLHMFTNGQYGFHRDELATLENARHLDWGYVAYPPLSVFLANLTVRVFGPTLVGLRSLSALAQGAAVVLTGWMVRDLGGSRRAQIAGAVAASISLMALIMGAMYQYIGLDYLWWVLAAFSIVRRNKTDDPRWWLGVGLAIGLGLQTRYTIAFLAAGIALGVLFGPLRRDLRSPWLWAGAGLSLLIFLPNLAWQVRNDFISLEFLSAINARDIAVGRTEGFISQQLYVSANPFTLPIWLLGLVSLLRGRPRAEHRVLAWMYGVPFMLLLVARGRFYYLAPAYPALLAAGSAAWERWLGGMGERRERIVWRVTWAELAIGGAFAAAVMLPLAPIGSGWWDFTGDLHDNFAEQIGWEELVETTAAVFAGLPEDEQAVTGILAGNFGELGALNLYGPAYGLPVAFSPINSFWYRGYGDPPPEIVIVLGFSSAQLESMFSDCEPAAEVSNRYGVDNEETRFHPQIYLCRGPRAPWPVLWESLRGYG